MIANRSCVIWVVPRVHEPAEILTQVRAKLSAPETEELEDSTSLEEELLIDEEDTPEEDDVEVEEKKEEEEGVKALE